MNHFDFFKHDLNLLVALDALLAERSVSRAAQRVGISQSAMSQTLRRLRDSFQDELFIRNGGGVEPTAFAERLRAPLREMLERAHAVLVERERFDPASMNRVFAVTMSDTQQLALMPRIVADLVQSAPAAAIRTIPMDPRRLDRQLDDGEVEIAVGRFESTESRHRMEDLYEEHHVALLNPALIPNAGKLTLDDYARHPHVLLTHSGDLRGVVDDILEKRKRSRRVVFSTPYAHAIPFILETSPAIGIVPARMAEQCRTVISTLAIAELPFRLEPYMIRMKWHARLDADPAIIWIRSQIRRVAGATPS